MLVAKLSDGRLVVMLKHNCAVEFDKTRRDWCLCYESANRAGHIDAIPRKQNLFWIPATRVSKLFDIEG